METLIALTAEQEAALTPAERGMLRRIEALERENAALREDLERSHSFLSQLAQQVDGRLRVLEGQMQYVSPGLVDPSVFGVRVRQGTVYGQRRS